MLIRRGFAIGSVLGWMLACGGGTDATPISDNSGVVGASGSTGGSSSNGTAGTATGSSGDVAAGGAMGTGGAMGAGGATGTGGASTGGSPGAGGSAMTDAQAGHTLDSGSDVAAMVEAAAPCAFDEKACQICIFADSNGPCYGEWKVCQNDNDPASMCAQRFKDADACACRYQTAGNISAEKARACINNLAQYGLISRNLEACINDKCAKECGIAL